ncbi:transcription factor domain-containing protein [Aspergillus alliaceus]|uniref:transcription factor domain-containing protein n=1 Tax=Petromyces alliaceus TaxID=209559 RepID=UPI0012A4BE68|nr:fungal-specific transcription factor domain-containing protein [Aspergillus alliaceus]KAB8239224.1 fungal-specific transcription factor domain-containing protein [Aspergillus alliaceus]
MVRKQQDNETANRQNASQSHREEDGVTDGRDGSPDEPRPKRQKRGKYASKACGQCQRRKIRCDGCIPCQPCVRNGRDCLMQTLDMRRRRTTGLTESGVTGSELNDYEQLTARDFSGRLNRIEHQLSLVLSSICRDKDIPVDKESRADEPTNPQQPTVRRNEVSDTAYGHPEHPMSCRASGTSLTAPNSPLGTSRELRETADIRKVLNAYGIDPHKDEWDAYMRTCCDEIHILYPFLHIPSLWAKYANMWRSGFSSSEHEFQRSGDYRIMIAQVWVCIALGRCTESPRVSSEQGKHSSGWSLFEAATDLIGDLVGCFRACSRPIVVLQTYALMVVYLFRLDANERAEKFLALAISHAHHVGFHRSKVVGRMSVFEDELVRRLWWSLYALDRRLAIETGHPFLIQDVNVDTPYPRNLDDDWLTRHKEDSRTTAELKTDIDAGLSRNPTTPIPYLYATIHYSRVVGKIWEAIYGANMTDVIPSSNVLEYLDQLISRVQKEIRVEFSDNHPSEPPNLEWSNPLRWKTKQQMLMRIRWRSLRLLIRKPILQQRASPQEPIADILETEVTCIRIASNIIQEFKQVPQYTPSAFPFLHPLVGATVVALGLIIREPSFKATYGSLTLHAAVSLENYCRRTWVSGKMIRTIRRLNQMTSSVLSDSSTRIASNTEPRPMAWPSLPTNPLTDHPSQTSTAIASNYTPVSSLANQNTESLSTSPIGLSQPINPSIHRQQVPDRWTVIPTNLVMVDFDFEQSLTTDLIPADHTYGWTVGTQANEIQQDGAAYMQMGWLESLFGTDLG